MARSACPRSFPRCGSLLVCGCAGAWTLPRSGARPRGSHELTDVAPPTADFSPAQHLTLIRESASRQDGKNAKAGVGNWDRERGIPTPRGGVFRDWLPWARNSAPLASLATLRETASFGLGLIVVLHGAPSFRFGLFLDERASVLAHSRIQFRNSVCLRLCLVDPPAKRAWGAEVELQ